MNIAHRIVLHNYSRVVPRMHQQVLRPQHRDGRLLRDHARERERGAHDIVAPTRNDARDKAHALRLGRGEVARGVRELVHEALVARDLGQARERPDVGGEADVCFLQRQSACRRAQRECGARTLIAKTASDAA